jgi:hypothetical protein
MPNYTDDLRITITVRARGRNNVQHWFSEVKRDNYADARGMLANLRERAHDHPGTFTITVNTMLGLGCVYHETITVNHFDAAESELREQRRMVEQISGRRR